eukprot:1159693-Pelagomonas_calceolata.AAC.1
MDIFGECLAVVLALPEKGVLRDVLAALCACVLEPRWGVAAAAGPGAKEDTQACLLSYHQAPSWASPDQHFHVNDQPNWGSEEELQKNDTFGSYPALFRYWRVTVPEADGESFALIYSIEDPAGTSPNAGLGVQVSKNWSFESTFILLSLYAFHHDDEQQTLNRGKQTQQCNNCTKHAHCLSNPENKKQCIFPRLLGN